MSSGSVLIDVAGLAGVTSLVAAIRWARGRQASERTARWAYHLMTAALAAASVLLLVAILTHDFRYSYVIGYSSRDLPLLYLISAFWGGQEGTFLLWALMGALIGYPLLRRRGWEPATVLACYTPSLLFLIGLMLDEGGNPFRLAAQVPADGRGLNPLLQDPWMAIHPPLVFLGYAAMTVPAALALTALLRRDERRWVDQSMRWALVGFVSLGIGIILGGFWAYKVLGWGGYWGWDPVENASLVPWIIVAALIHGLLVQKHRQGLQRTNLVLALSGYLLVLYATFLTRSGVLADFSVHSFPKGSLYRWLVAGMLVMLVVSVWALLRRREPDGRPVEMNAGWPFLLSAIIVVLSMHAALVLFGTSWPIISSALGKAVVPGIAFYNQVSLPLYVAVLLVLGIAPFAGWTVASWREWDRKLIVSAVVAVALTALAVALGGRGVDQVALFCAAAFALTSNLIRFFVVARSRLLNTGAAIAHLGFAMMVVGIVTSSAWDREAELRLPLNQPVEALGRTLTYRGHLNGSDPQDRWIIDIAGADGTTVTATPAMYDIPQRGAEPMLMRKPAILRSWNHDLYVVALGQETGRQVLSIGQDHAARYGDAQFAFLGFGRGQSSSGGFTVLAHMALRRDDGREENFDLELSSGASGLTATPTTPEALPGVELSLQRISVEEHRVEVLVTRADGGEQLVASVSVKPMMSLLWLGTLVMLVGCSVAWARRRVDAVAALSAAPVAQGRRRSAA